MEEWTILIRNAIAVLVIITAIAIVIFLTFMGLNSANRGGEKLSELVGALDARAMETYDQKTVSGATVMAAIKNYRISDSSKFRSCIIYNANDEAVGIYMRQTTAPTSGMTPLTTNHVFRVP